MTRLYTVVQTSRVVGRIASTSSGPWARVSHHNESFCHRLNFCGAQRREIRKIGPIRSVSWALRCPEDRKNPRALAKFASFSGECRTGQTAWRMTQSDANHSLGLNSLLNRENTVNFSHLWQFQDSGWQKKSGKHWSFLKNSLEIITGNFQP